MTNPKVLVMVVKGKREFAEAVTIHTVDSNKAGDFVQKNTSAGKHWSDARVISQGKECEIYDFSQEFIDLQRKEGYDFWV